MEPQAYQKDKLVKAGLAGFAILDDLYGRNKESAGRLIPSPQACGHHHQHYHNYSQQPHINSRPQVITVIKKPVIDSNQAAQLYGGVAVVDHRLGKLIRRA